jgi:hypothetical protein
MEPQIRFCTGAGGIRIACGREIEGHITFEERRQVHLKGLIAR